jgi:beta-N-acetylhexosaminidase
MGMAMSAHVIYTAFDARQPATTSPGVIEGVIRGEIGFDGLLMTDDLSMKALSGDFSARATSSLAAGCDVVLHCNGLMDEMLPVAAAVPVLAGRSLARAIRALEPLGRRDDADEASLRTEFAALIGAVA